MPRIHPGRFVQTLAIASLFHGGCGAGVAPSPPPFDRDASRPDAGAVDAAGREEAARDAALSDASLDGAMIDGGDASVRSCSVVSVMGDPLLSDPVDTTDRRPSLATRGADVDLMWSDALAGNPDVRSFLWPAGVEGGSVKNIAVTVAREMSPSITAFGDGYAAAWFGNLDGNFEIYARLLDNEGNTASDTVRLTSNSLRDSLPALAANGDNLFVYWIEEDAMGARVAKL